MKKLLVAVLCSLSMFAVSCAHGAKSCADCGKCGTEKCECSMDKKSGGKCEECAGKK